MPTLDLASGEELRAVKRELTELRQLLAAYVQSQEEWLDTAAALRAAGLKARSTLVEFARAMAPGVKQEGRITYKKEGTKCFYLRSSCIDYAQRKQGQPALAS